MATLYLREVVLFLACESMVYMSDIEIYTYESNAIKFHSL
jgi:hypothetical protein